MKKRNDNTADDALVEKARRLFEESVDGLDADTQSRLNRGRQVALAAATQQRYRWTQWAPAGGVAVAAVAALVVWTGVSRNDLPGAPAEASDMEILLTEDSFEMLEDLEFYSWVDLEDDAIEI